MLYTIPCSEVGYAMTTNAPPFDPLNPTPEEQDDMVAGYMAAGKDDPKPELASIAFEHGWRMRRNDRAKIVDDDQRALVKRYKAMQR